MATTTTTVNMFSDSTAASTWYINSSGTGWNDIYINPNAEVHVEERVLYEDQYVCFYERRLLSGPERFLYDKIDCVTHAVMVSGRMQRFTISTGDTIDIVARELRYSGKLHVEPVEDKALLLLLEA